jgi:hypothetical protein
MDLVGRKMGLKNGAFLFALMGLLNDFVDAHASHPVLEPQMKALAGARDAWTEVNGFFMTSVMEKQLMIPLINASAYLSLTGDLLLGYLLLDQARIACDKLEPLCQQAGVDPKDGKALSALAQKHPDVRYYDGKVKGARFFCANELPQVHAKAAAIKSKDMSAMHVVWDDE